MKTICIEWQKICKKCKHTPFISDMVRYNYCKKPSIKLFSYVSGEYLESPINYDHHYDDCEEKNKTGCCSDFIPLDFNDRINYIIGHHGRDLSKSLNSIVKNASEEIDKICSRNPFSIYKSGTHFLMEMFSGEQNSEPIKIDIKRSGNMIAKI